MNEFKENEFGQTEETAEKQTQTTGEMSVRQEQTASQHAQQAAQAHVQTERGAQQTGQTPAWNGRNAQQTYQQNRQTYNRAQGYGHSQQAGGYQQNPEYRQGYQQGQNGQQGYQQNNWNGQPHYNYYQRQQAAQQNEAKKKNGLGSGKRWAAVVAMALVFGLIAGTAAYGINRAAGTLMPGQAQTEASAPAEKAETRLTLTNTGTVSSVSDVPVPVSGTKTVAQVANDALPALVTISTMSVQEMRSYFGTQKYEAQGAGTGVIVGENDTELLIATNNHVVQGAQEVSIGFIDESVAEAQIKGTDSQNDLAVVAVKLEDISDETMDQIKIAVIGDSDALVLGDQVVAIGNALGVGQSVTSGYVSGLNRELDLSDGYNNFTSTGLIQTDAAINSGNSGGALLNMQGELIGINEAKSAYTSSGVSVDNVGYAIPMSKAQPILEELMNQVTREKYSEDEQGYLGVSLVNVSDEFAMLYGTPQGVGFAEVAEDSPAAEAGAQKGDILTEFGGKTMTSVEDVMNEIQYYRSGNEVEITVLRADNGEYKEINLTVTLGTKEAISSLQAQ